MRAGVGAGGRDTRGLLVSQALAAGRPRTHLRALHATAHPCLSARRHDVLLRQYLSRALERVVHQSPDDVTQVIPRQFMSYQIMWTLISLPLQMAECLRRVQPVSVANHVIARQSPIKRAVT